MKHFDQIGGHGGGGSSGIHYDIIGRAFEQADAMGGPALFNDVGQRGGGMRGGGRGGGGFRGGFRGGRGGRVVRNFQGSRFRVIDVVPRFPWWGASWWYPAAYAPSVYTAYPQQFADACTALGRAEAQGAPADVIANLRVQCGQLVYAQQPAVAPAALSPYGYGYGYGATPWGRPGYLAY